MRDKLFKVVKAVSKEISKVREEGAYLYVDKKGNFNVSNKNPGQKEVLFNLKPYRIVGRKEKTKLKLKKVQEQLKMYGVALQSDLDNLEKKLSATPKKKTKKKTTRKTTSR